MTISMLGAIPLLPVPDFDEYYVTDRDPKAIARAQYKWCELEQFKLKVNRLAGEIKNNREALARLKDVRGLDQAKRIQCKLKTHMHEMQNHLAALNVDFRACSVIRLTYMQKAFMDEAEKLLPRETFQAIRKNAVELIREQLDKLPPDRKWVPPEPISPSVDTPVYEALDYGLLDDFTAEKLALRTIVKLEAGMSATIQAKVRNKAIRDLTIYMSKFYRTDIGQLSHLTAEKAVKHEEEMEALKRQRRRRWKGRAA